MTFGNWKKEGISDRKFLLFSRMSENQTDFLFAIVACENIFNVFLYKHLEMVTHLTLTSYSTVDDCNSLNNSNRFSKGVIKRWLKSLIFTWISEKPSIWFQRWRKNDAWERRTEPGRELRQDLRSAHWRRWRNDDDSWLQQGKYIQEEINRPGFVAKCCGSHNFFAGSCYQLKYIAFLIFDT